MVVSRWFVGLVGLPVLGWCGFVCVCVGMLVVWDWLGAVAVCLIVLVLAFLWCDLERLVW